MPVTICLLTTLDYVAALVDQDRWIQFWHRIPGVDRDGDWKRQRRRRNLEARKIQSQSRRRRAVVALARCEECGSPKGLKQMYPYSHYLASLAQILCGAPHCTRVAMIWLTDDEEQRYLQEGIRLFRISKGPEVELQ